MLKLCPTNGWRRGPMTQLFAFKVHITQDDSQRRFSAQHSVAVLKQCRT